MRDKNLVRRIKEMSEWYNCPVATCDRIGFTKRGLTAHMKIRHADYLLQVSQITKSNE